MGKYEAVKKIEKFQKTEHPGFKFNYLFLGTKFKLLFDLGQRLEELCAGIRKLNKKRAEEKKTPLSIVHLLPFFDYEENRTWIKNRT